MVVTVFGHLVRCTSVCGLIAIMGCTASTPDSQPITNLPTKPPDVDIDLEEPTSITPAVFGAAVIPADAKVGETVTFVIQAAMADGWHIYAADLDSTPSVSTSLKLALPAGVKAVDQWVYPEAKEYTSELGKSYAYEGRVSFYRQLLITDGASGNTPIRCSLKFQRNASLSQR